MLASPYKEFKEALLDFIPKDRIHTDPLRLLAYGTDASVYRLTPKIVVDVLDEAEVVQLVALADRMRVPVTFRAAGTSLSGQAVSDSVLVRIGKGWRNWRVGENAERITLQPGIIGSGANKILAEFGKKIGPDPASIDSCLIGGIFANNASGMCCGTSDNSYKTVVSSRMVLADGTLLDTADAKSRAAFARTHAHILNGLADLRKQIMDNPELADRIRRKFKIKNTTGYSLNALVDYEDPFEILQHVMVGSEGTLGFIAEVTYRTVEEAPFKASVLLLLPTVKAACDLASAVATLPVAAAELMEKRRRQKRQRQGGAEDAQDREDAAQHPGGLGACKGGGIDAQRAGCHLGDGDEVRQIGVRHPAVGGHFIHDEGDHGGAAEAGEADLRKRGEELNEGLKHGHVRSPPSRPAR